MKTKITLILLSLIVSGFAFGQTTINTFDKGHHTGANTLTENFTFPDDNSGVSQILMHFRLSCPAGGCDPWDRYAHIQLVKGETNIEIGRYVTPYGNDWCDWTLDVTEYRNLLQGDVTLKSFIETWSNGWEVTVDFEFIDGAPDYEFVKVDNLWQDYNFIYGDTIFRKLDLGTRTVWIPENAQKTVIRVVNTGHGQGNTDNAAEFSQKTHLVMVDKQEAYQHELWKDDCAQNPCSPQGGTWTNNRAGWCPGQHVVPTDFDITSLVTPGETVDLDYVLEPFFNLCSPWNPDCENGVTCASCTYNSNGHTEPNYKFSIQLLNYGSTQFTSRKELKGDPFQVNVYPNPSNGIYRLSFAKENNTAVNVRAISLTGTEVYNEQFGNVAGHVYDLDLSAQPNGAYFLIFQDGDRILRKKIVLAQ